MNDDIVFESQFLFNRAGACCGKPRNQRGKMTGLPLRHPSNKGDIVTVIQFATCERKKALEYIQKVFPSLSITDSDDSAGPLLDFVEQDIVRIQDPFMYGNKIQVVPGKKWVEHKETRERIVAACKIFHDKA